MERFSHELEKLRGTILRPVILFFIVSLALLVIGTPTLATQIFLSAKSFLVPNGVLLVALGPVSVFVAPMVSGAGIKNKVLQALSMERPIVATSLGRSGIESTPAIVDVDSAEEFAGEVVKLLQSPAHRSKLGAVGRKFVLKCYSWDHSTSALVKIARETLEKLSS